MCDVQIAIRCFRFIFDESVFRPTLCSSAYVQRTSAHLVVIYETRWTRQRISNIFYKAVRTHVFRYLARASRWSSRTLPPASQHISRSTRARFSRFPVVTDLAEPVSKPLIFVKENFKNCFDCMKQYLDV